MVWQNPGHVGSHSYPQTAHPQGTTTLENLAPDTTSTTDATDSTTPSNDPDNPDPENQNHEIGPANPTDTIGQAYRDAGHPYDIDHIEPVAFTDHTQHVSAGEHHDQSTSYVYGHYFPVQDSGYQSSGSTPRYALCAVGRNYLISSLAFLKRSWVGRFATLTLNTSIRTPRKRRPTVQMSVGLRSRLSLHKHSKALNFTCAPHQCLTLFVAICSYPGCTYPAVMHPADYRGNYCSESHE